MTDYGRTQSTEKPEHIVVDDYSVWVHTDIQEIFENIGTESEFAGYEFNMVQYDKNEFIKMQAAENSQLSKQITDMQLALCEVYELMV